MEATKRICIAGAGSSGLTSIKACLEEDLLPVCFEKTDQIGGLWCYREDDVEGVGSVMKSTITNTSKEMSAFSDFPPPKDFPTYMHNSYLLKYFEMYAEKFDLVRHIRFRHEILKVEQNHDFDETGQWKITIRDIENNVHFDEIFDGMMVCTGHHVFPYIPTFLEIEKFKGKVLHTHSYKKPDGYDAKKVVIVGVGNSAGDVTVELSQIAKQVYLSVRNGCWIIPRTSPGGKPLDASLFRRWWNLIWFYTPYKLLRYFVDTFVGKETGHSPYCFRCKRSILEQRSTVNDELRHVIQSGAVTVKGNIRKFTENGVVFEGEETEYEVDIVILATGYDIKFPFLDQKIVSIRKQKLELYKYVVPIRLKHPTLGMIALAQPVGSLFPIAEIQARWFALLMNKKVCLPSVKQMLSDIKKKMDMITRRYPDNIRYTIVVDWIPLMDETACLINAKPNLLKLILTDPKLFWKCFWGPCLPYQFRLQGPHAWAGARNAILSY
ncbi:flavin-containing monooxygenase 5-like [Tachypleus tridentatus]|uniref:flavin-containing monooxygenase 5-like n=1 Tax=Tachypleus tridentatus TaxID=6853 RepID=UPI003FD19F32